MLAEFAQYFENHGIQKIGAILFVLSWVLEVSKIKINPWSWIARHVGTAINKDVMQKVSELEGNVNKLRDEVQNIRNDAGEQNALNARSRILRFGDEIRYHTPHSKEHFDQILRDITKYDSYCDTHKDFKNNAANVTSKIIINAYQEHLEKNDFL